MTAPNTKPYFHPSDAVNLLDIFDNNGRVDSVKTEAVNREIFSESNTVRRADGTIDHVATIAQHAVAKVAAVNKRK
jgi:hypothetical protein